MVRVLGLSSFVAWAACVCAKSSPQLDTLCEEEELEEFSTLQLRGVLDVAATGTKTGMFGMDEHEDEEEDVEADDDEDDDNAAVLLGTDDQVKSPILPDESSRLSAHRWMQYGWVPDGGAPNLLRSKRQLFDLGWGTDLHATRLTGGRTVMTKRESLSSTQSDISANLGVSASYGAFSGALGLSVNTGAMHTHKQMVTIRRTTVESAEVVNNLGISNLRNKMTEDAVDAINSNGDPQDIVDFLGEFYVDSMTLGGVIETQFQQTQTESDSYSEFLASVEANVDALVVSAAARQEMSIFGSATGSAMSLHVTTRMQGGETAFWGGSGSRPIDEIQRDWATSLQGGALVHPIAFVLQPIWKLVKQVNRNKGRKVEKHLKDQWKEAQSQLANLDVLSPVASSSRLVLAEGCYRIQQKATLRFLDAFTRNNDYQLVTNPRQNNPSQFWYIASFNDDDGYTIRQVGDNEGQRVGRYLDAYQDQQSDFRATTRPVQSDTTQQWFLTASDDDTFTIEQDVATRPYLDAHQVGSYNVVTRNTRQVSDSRRWKFTALTSDELTQATGLLRGVV